MADKGPILPFKTACLVLGGVVQFAGQRFHLGGHSLITYRTSSLRLLQVSVCLANTLSPAGRCGAKRIDNADTAPPNFMSPRLSIYHSQKAD